MAYLLAQLTAMPDDCTTWPYSRRGRGYGQVWFSGRMHYVHTLVCEWYHGPRPAGQEVRHTCGNGHLGCFTPAHLRWGTRAENVQDAVTHGTHASVTRRLTPEQEAEIRSRYRPRQRPTMRTLAREYGVSELTIWKTIRQRGD